MIKIQTVNPTGLFSFGEVKDVDLTSLGLCRVEGRNLDDGGSNGSGKTSFFNSLPQLMFSESESNATATKIVNAVWGKGCRAYVEFEDSRSDKYRISICRSWKGGDPRPDGLSFDQWNGEKWKDRRGKDIHETKRKIQQVVGFSYRQFLTMAYMTQRLGLKFIEEPALRPKVFTEMLDLGIYDRAADVARKRHNAKSKDLELLITRKETIERDLRERELQVDDNLDILETSLESENESRCMYVVSFDLCSEKKKELETRLLEVETKLGKFDFEENDVRRRAEAEKQSAENIQSDELNKLMTAKSVVESQKVSRKRRLDQLITTDEGICPKCGSKVTKEHLDDLKIELEQEIKLFQRAESATRIKALIMKEGIEVEISIKLDSINKQLEDELVEIHKRKLVLVDEKSEVEKDLLIIEPSWRELNSSIGEINHNISKIEGEIEVWRKVQVEIEEKKEEVDRLTQDENKLQDGITKLKWVEKHFKKLKLYLFEEALKIVNQLLNKFLSILYDGRMSVVFDTKRLRAGADTKRNISDEDYIESLSVLVQHGKKMNVALEEYSGGEKQLIALALVAAFWELVDTTTQNGINVLMLDEVFGNLDDIRKEGVVRFLEYLRNRCKSILVSDNTGVCDEVDIFDSKLVMEKKDDITQIYLEAA